MTGYKRTISDFGALCLLFLMCFFLLISCSPSSSEGGSWKVAPEKLVETHRGQVLVLLMGMKGCPGTAAATEVLKEYSAKKEPGVAIVRVDVPPPSGELISLDKGSLPFGYGIDKNRVLARKLDFFYYPTLYIFGPEGEIRYSGGCNKDEVLGMVSEILAEKPGDEKHVYTLPLPEVGTAAPEFSGVTLAGAEVSLRGLLGGKATAMLFARTNCPFAVQALAGMKKLDDVFKRGGVSFLIVNRGESAQVIRPVYEEKTPGMTVIHDKGEEIADSYGISAVPFLFLLDEQGKIANRMPYTQESAENGIRQALGLETEAFEEPAQGAG